MPFQLNFVTELVTKRNRPYVEVMVSLHFPCEACGIFCLEGYRP